MLPLTAGLSAVFSIEGLFCRAAAAPKLDASGYGLSVVKLRILPFCFHLYHQFFSFLFSGQAEELRRLITFDSSEERPFLI